MTQTEETNVVYCKPGYTIRAKIKYGLRQLIIYERRQHGVSSEEVSQAIGIPATKLKEIEQHKKHLNWYILDRLLRYYRKQIEIKLVDLDRD
ncbi:MAG: helix-turn-helix domain-containing protein [Alphaproteobacteria bacterium]|nr:helix-turn-helix domain-containing protein [Alphaproteobacteria bacterium]MBP3686818.1 helix-turn-helix domain-containing protein [Alphaproteobacteria bacterium]